MICGYVYITTNNINNKKYIGQSTVLTEKAIKEYLGSGWNLVPAIKKYGKENFSKEIVYWGESLNDLNEYEEKLIAFYNAAESKEFYNIHYGGKNKQCNPETRAKISLKVREAIHKIQTPEANQKRSQSLKGHIVTEETRKKIAKIQKGRKHTAESRRNMSRASKNKKKLIYNDEICFLFYY